MGDQHDGIEARNLTWEPRKKTAAERTTKRNTRSARTTQWGSGNSTQRNEPSKPANMRRQKRTRPRGPPRKTGNNYTPRTARDTRSPASTDQT